MGFTTPTIPINRSRVDKNGLIQISRWRHAVINFPHPLLKQGLVILDTPGLNAIGTEPELTLSLVPNAHAVLFILAADTGVTKSDLDVWRHLVGDAAARNHIVVLNKIDGLWDALKTPGEMEMEVRRQVSAVAAHARARSDARVSGLGAKGSGRQSSARRKAVAGEPAAVA